MWPHRLVVPWLAFGALLYAAIGAAGLVAPAQLLALVDIPLPTPSALSEARAFFGAQSLVLAAILARGLFRPAARRAAVALFVALAAAFAAARLLSLAVDGPPGAVPAVLLAMETAGVASGALLLRLTRPGAG